jgi:hypothetical protein
MEWSDNAGYFEGLAIADVDNDSCMEVISNGDYLSNRLYVFDSSTPVSGCSVIGEGNDLGVRETVPPLSLYVRPLKGYGLEVRTGREVPVSVYSADGRLAGGGWSTGGSIKFRLGPGVYIVKVGGNAVSVVVK